MDALEAILAAGAAAHERFVNDFRAMDKAWSEGKLTEYIDQQLQQARDEYNADDEQPAQQPDASGPVGG